MVSFVTTGKIVLKIHWFEEDSTLFRNIGVLGVEVPNYTVLLSHGFPHNVGVSDSSFVSLVCESIRLLVVAVVTSVVSREWIEGSKHVPSGT